MPLAHKKSTMVFIMPYQVESLERVEKMLTKEQLDTWIGKLQQTAVAVSLPKFSMEVSHNLQVKAASGLKQTQSQSHQHLHILHDQSYTLLFLLLFRNTYRIWA